MKKYQRGARTMITAEWLSEHNACEPGIAWWHAHGKIADVDACIQALADDEKKENWVEWLAEETGWTGHVVTTRHDGYRCESWYRDGARHREDGPAYVKTYPDGFRSELWYRNGACHRDDGPAWIETCPDGTRWEEWWRDDRRCAK